MSLLLLSLAEYFWQPALPPLRLIALAIALTALAVLTYARLVRGHPRRAAALLAMRVIAILALIALLFGPSTAKLGDRFAQKPALTIALDTSRSMQTADAPTGSRLSHMLRRELSPERLDALADRFRLRIVGFHDDTQALGQSQLAGSPERLLGGERTDYAAALRELGGPAEVDSTRAIGLLVGDGHHTADASLETALRQLGGDAPPIHTLTLGRPDPAPEIALTGFVTPERLIVGERGRLVVRLHQAGLAGRAVTMSVKRDGERIERRQVKLKTQPITVVRVPIEADQSGLHTFRVAAGPLPGESNTANNRQTVFANADEGLVTVLLLEGDPFWSTTFLARALRTDPRIRLAHVAQVTPERTQRTVTRLPEQRARVPGTKQQWQRFDVVILGRRVERLLNAEAAKQLAERIGDGGRLILARGRPGAPEAGGAIADALSPVMPAAGRGAREGREGTLRLTPAGRAASLLPSGSRSDRGERFLTALPPLRVRREIDALKPATRVLARLETKGGETLPAIVEMPYGRGRVMAVLAEGLWRWRMNEREGRWPAGLFGRFWRNAVRRLAVGDRMPEGQQVRLELSRHNAEAGEPLWVEAVTRDMPPDSFAPQISVTDPPGETRTLSLESSKAEPRRWRAQLRPETAGVWNVRLNASPLRPATADTRFGVQRVDVEMLRAGAQPGTMRRIARETDGVTLQADHEVDLAHELAMQYEATTRPPTRRYAWDRPWVLAALLLWLGLEWLARRRAGWL